MEIPERNEMKKKHFVDKLKVIKLVKKFNYWFLGETTHVNWYLRKF